MPRAAGAGWGGCAGAGRGPGGGSCHCLCGLCGGLYSVRFGKRSKHPAHPQRHRWMQERTGRLFAGACSCTPCLMLRENEHPRLARLGHVHVAACGARWFVLKDCEFCGAAPAGMVGCGEGGFVRAAFGVITVEVTRKRPSDRNFTAATPPLLPACLALFKLITNSQ